jgi:hypothetical protein
VYSKQIVALVNYDYRTKKYDGYTVFRKADVDAYYVWKKNEFLDRKENATALLQSCIISKGKTIYGCLKKIVEAKKLVAFYVGEDFKTYFVGQIKTLDRKKVTFKLINRDGVFTQQKTFQLKAIHYISFDTRYEFSLLRKMK